MNDNDIESRLKKIEQTLYGRNKVIISIIYLITILFPIALVMYCGYNHIFIEEIRGLFGVIGMFTLVGGLIVLGVLGLFKIWDI